MFSQTTITLLLASATLSTTLLASAAPVFMPKPLTPSPAALQRPLLHPTNHPAPQPNTAASSPLKASSNGSGPTPREKPLQLMQQQSRIHNVEAQACIAGAFAMGNRCTALSKEASAHGAAAKEAHAVAREKLAVYGQSGDHRALSEAVDAKARAVKARDEQRLARKGASEAEKAVMGNLRKGDRHLKAADEVRRQIHGRIGEKEWW